MNSGELGKHMEWVETCHEMKQTWGLFSLHHALPQAVTWVVVVGFRSWVRPYTPNQMPLGRHHREVLQADLDRLQGGMTSSMPISSILNRERGSNGRVED